jgi:RNA polymerase sigma-B factor
MAENPAAETGSALFEEYTKTKDVALRNQIVEKYLYLVDILIRRYLNKGVDYDDLYQVGSLALVYAVERFQPEKGFEFASFATPTIIGEIKRYFRDKGWAMKVPRRLKEISAQIPAAKEELYLKLHRTPTVTELGAQLGYSDEDILEAMESGKNYSTYSLNQAFEEANDSGEGTSLEQYTGIDEKGYESFENSELIQHVYEGFNDREKEIFNSRFIRNKTQQDVAAELGVSQMTVSRVENQIKQKFKEEYHR